MGLANLENRGMTILRRGVVRDGGNIDGALAALVPHPRGRKRDRPAQDLFVP